MTDLSRRLYVKNFADWEQHVRRKCFSEKTLDIKVVKDGIILPTRILRAGSVPGQKEDKYVGGVCDSRMNFVAGFRRGSEKAPGVMCVMEPYPVSPGEITYYDEDVIFGGIVLGHFGHFMLEGMSRFWYFLQNDDSGRRIAIATAIWLRQPWFDDFFRVLGIDLSRIIYIDAPSQFASVIVPEESVHSWDSFFTREYLVPYEIMRRNVPAGKYRKIYLTRRHYDDGLVTCCNEEYF